MKRPLALARIMWLAVSLVSCGALSPKPTSERWPYLSYEVRRYLTLIEPHTFLPPSWRG